MGWLLIVKIYEDEFYVTYAYSHDSDILDGSIKVEKAIGHSEENRQRPMKDLADIKPSTTDTNNFWE